MTTSVPDGTPDEAVQDVRDREAAHSRDLAAQGHLLRLWRPPLKPGEWRTLGLFAAEDDSQLGDVLTSMPLRVWRTDEVTPLSPHPNDPARQPETAADTATAEAASDGSGSAAGEFLVTFAVTVPAGTPGQAVEDTEAREAQRARELAGQGSLLRLWALPGQERALGLWRARDAGGLQAIMDSLPLEDWMTIEVTPLSAHPSDPALARR